MQRKVELASWLWIWDDAAFVDEPLLLIVLLLQQAVGLRDQRRAFFGIALLRGQFADAASIL